MSRRSSARLPALLASMLLLPALLASCTNHDATLGVSVAPPLGVQVSFKNDVLLIFANPKYNCAASNCHTSSALGAPMSLDASQAYGNLVGVTSCEAPGLKRVNPPSSASSYLIIKLEGTQSRLDPAICEGCPMFTVAGSCGTQMPQTGQFLSTSEVQVIRDWIDQGAQDN